ncbi:hypothetical protein BGW39_001463, partial [Mortierella sp. 14UC]
HDLIEKQLQYLNFADDQIKEMKLHRQFVLICDGYDESQLKINIHATNNFNQPGQWKVKMVISCRTQYLGQDYRSRFQPHSLDRYQCTVVNLFQEVVVAPFSRAQIQQYVEVYVKGLPTVDPLLSKPSWTAKEYMDKLVNIPNLMDLVSNPFLLSLSLDALPSIVKSHKDISAIRITRVQLYDSFVRRWLEVNRARLEESPLSELERSELDLLVEDNFLYYGTHFQKDLATAIFIKHERNPVVKYTPLRDKGTWKAAFFAPEGQAKLLRESKTVIAGGGDGWGEEGGGDAGGDGWGDAGVVLSGDGWGDESAVVVDGGDEWASEGAAVSGWGHWSGEEEEEEAAVIEGDGWGDEDIVVTEGDAW